MQCVQISSRPQHAASRAHVDFTYIGLQYRHVIHTQKNKQQRTLDCILLHVHKCCFTEPQAPRPDSHKKMQGADFLASIKKKRKKKIHMTCLYISFSRF